MQRKLVPATNSIYVLRVFDGEILNQVMESTKCGIVQRAGCVRGQVPIGLIGLVYVVYFNPCREMRFVAVKERLHPILHHVRYDALELGMCDPVFSCIFRQLESFEAHFVDKIIQMEKTSETSLRKDGVGGTGKDLISGEISE